MNATIVIASYNTAQLLKNCYESIRKYEPDITVIIVDQSVRTNSCFKYAQSIKSINTSVIHVPKNIGHGKALNLGSKSVKTKYFIVMDSDAVLLKNGVIKSMIDEIESYSTHYNCYGIGQVVYVDRHGMNTENGIPYLHPYFALINKNLYNRFPLPINHGAPFLETMINLFQTKKGFVSNFDLTGLVHHVGRGTRKLNPKEFHPKNWEKI